MNPLEYIAHCPDCHAERWVTLLPIMAKDFPGVVSAAGTSALGMACDACLTKRDRKVKEENARLRVEFIGESWQSLCPIEFRTIQEGGWTDGDAVGRVLLTKFDQGIPSPADAEELSGWSPMLSLKRPVTLLLGPPGTMKTRLAWRLARACFDAEGSRPVPFLFQSSWEFQARLQDEAGKFNASRWVRSQIEVPLWILDDLCKTEWTDNTSAAFFEILDQRIAHHRPLLITGNTAAADLKAWFVSSKSNLLRESAEAIMRRLREHGTVFTARKP